MQVLPPSSTGGPSRLFIMRPVATTLLMMGILVFGWMSYLRLPLSENPNIDSPGLSVIAPCPFRRCRKWTIRPFRWSRSTQVPARMS